MPQLTSTYGYFSDDGKEYVITRPDTPMPWVNVLTNGDFGMVVSQAGSGYSWRTHASLNRITRWEQDLIRDEWGKYLYLRDKQSGEFWSPTAQPCGSELKGYHVRHGMGYSIIEAQHGTLASSVTYFVPLDAPCELWLLKLHNQANETRTFQIFTYLEWLLGAAPDWHREFHRTFIENQYKTEHGTMLASKVLWELPIESKSHWNRSWAYTAFHSASLKPVGFDGDKRDFIGRHGNVHQPQAVINGQSSCNAGRWGDPIASLQLEITLASGEACEIAFTLGAADDETQALALAQTYQNLETVHAALDEVKGYWYELISPLVIETPDQSLNLLANGWLQYQAIAGRIKGRTAYYQTGGAYGFRDQLQDSLIWLLLGKPEYTLEQIRLHAAHQYQDGIVLHWWHPIADTGMRSYYSDGMLWLAFAVIYYLRETGDFACLDEEIPFYDGGLATLKEHCLCSFELALKRRSERGLPLILKGDWNDGLNAVGVDGKGESVWMAHFLYYLLLAWADLPICDPDVANYFRQEAAALKQAVNQVAWDGEWYWRASTDDGNLIGSKQSPEGKIFLNAQTWAVLSGTADPERAEQVMQATREHLYSLYGPLLLAPAYSQPDAAIGYLTRYAPGVRENGGVYCHAACWAVLAERRLHDAQSAYEVWRSFCPPVQSYSNPDRYSGEPYVMPGNVAGPLATVPGQAGWTWYTGSAAWYLRALVDGVLGVEAHLQGLRVLTDLPDEWDHFRIQRWFRGALYDITVMKASISEQPGCYVDGQVWQDEFLPIAPPGTKSIIKMVIS